MDNNITKQSTWINNTNKEMQNTKVTNKSQHNQDNKIK